jgi:hypothetical protein
MKSERIYNDTPITKYLQRRAKLARIKNIITRWSQHELKEETQSLSLVFPPGFSADSEEML